MDRLGNQINVDDAIIFNQAESYYRDSYVLAWVTKVSPTGALDADVIRTEKIRVPEANKYDITVPDFNHIIGKIRLIPKRGRDSGPGRYRYDKRDTTVYHYDSNTKYYEG